MYMELASAASQSTNALSFKTETTSVNTSIYD